MNALGMREAQGDKGSEKNVDLWFKGVHTLEVMNSSRMQSLEDCCSSRDVLVQPSSGIDQDQICWQTAAEPVVTLQFDA